VGYGICLTGFQSVASLLSEFELGFKVVGETFQKKFALPHDSYVITL